MDKNLGILQKRCLLPGISLRGLQIILLNYYVSDKFVQVLFEFCEYEIIRIKFVWKTIIL